MSLQSLRFLVPLARIQSCFFFKFFKKNQLTFILNLNIIILKIIKMSIYGSIIKFSSSSKNEGSLADNRCKFGSRSKLFKSAFTEVLLKKIDVMIAANLAQTVEDIDAKIKLLRGQFILKGQPPEEAWEHGLLLQFFNRTRQVQVSFEGKIDRFIDSLFTSMNVQV
jgi:hypothetical protein